jgi:hypothetical protein
VVSSVCTASCAWPSFTVDGPESVALSIRGGSSLGPDRCGHRHQIIVHRDGIDTLIVQAQEKGDGCTVYDPT